MANCSGNHFRTGGFRLIPPVGIGSEHLERQQRVHPRQNGFQFAGLFRRRLLTRDRRGWYEPVARQACSAAVTLRQCQATDQPCDWTTDQSFTPAGLVGRGIGISERSLLRRRLSPLEEMPGNVWPEFDKLRTDHTFSGHCKRAIYCLPKAAIRSRIISIRNATGDEVSQHIRVVWSPGAVIAPAPIVVAAE